MTTQTQAKLIMDHILQTVFQLPADSPLEKAPKHNGYVAPEDFLMETDEILDDLDYPNDAGAMVKIIKGNAGMLKTFKQYAAHQAQQGTPIVDNERLDITRKAFNIF